MTTSSISAYPAVYRARCDARNSRSTFGGARLTRRGRAVLAVVLGSVLLAGTGAAAARVVAASAAEPIAASSAPTTISVVVQPGDNLWTIARNLNGTRDPREVVTQIRELNHLGSSRIMPGDVLVIPLYR